MSVKVSAVMPADIATSSYECTDCGKIFRRDAILRRHRENTHADGDTGRRYRCETCRRPFPNKSSLLTHHQVAHGTACRPADGFSTTKLDSRVYDIENVDSECLLPVDDCCVDDEICVVADTSSEQFHTQLVDNKVSEDSVEHVAAQGRAALRCRSTTTSNCSSVNTPAAATVVRSSASLQCTTNNNNNNCQIKNKNVLTHLLPTIASADRGARSTLASCANVRSVDAKSVATVASGAAAVQLARPTANDASVLWKAQIDTPSPTPTSLLSSGRLLSACRSAAEAPKSTNFLASQTPVYANIDQHKAPKSPLAAETFHGDVRKPGDTAAPNRSVTTPTTQKIIFYVKTEPNQHQQIAYCAAESVSCAGAKLSYSAPCQFVCPVCSREFVSEKYLSMHVSSIHRAGSDIASVIALETAALPRVEAQKVNLASSPSRGSAVDVAVATPVITPAILTTQPSASTSVGGAKSHWTCNICQKTFAQNSSYKNHIRTHSDDRPYVCSICSIGFKERYHLKKHELFKHTTTLNETCRICGKRFKDSTAVRAHERIHSDIRPYGCTLCGKTFKTSECLWHHENRSKTCGKMASRSKELGVAVASAATRVVTLPRQRQRRGGGGLNTATASTRLPRPSSVVQLAQLSPPLDDTKPELSDLAPPPVADNSGEAKPLEVESTNHEMGDACDETLIKTEPDCELFDNLSAMLDSTDAAFSDFWPTLDDLDPVTSAGYSPDDDAVSSPDPISSSPDTTDAESTRSAEESAAFIGPTAGSFLACSGSVKRYDCERCDKRFASAATLAKHLQVHDEIRPYRCAICDIGFKLKVHLKKHNLYRHSKEYPCECSICGKRFKDSSAVRLHERIHSTDRPFQCLQCGKSFKTRENLWGHRNRGPCEQRASSSLLMTSPITSYPVSTAEAPQFVSNNVRLFHSAEFGPILGVPVNAKLVFKEEKVDKVSERPASVAGHHQSSSMSNKSTAPPSTPLSTTSSTGSLRRVSAVRIGETTRLAVSKISAVSCGGGVSSAGVSVPTAVVTPIKRDMIDDRKITTLVSTTSTSVLAGNIAISTPSSESATSHVIGQKRPAIDNAGVTPSSKFLAVDNVMAGGDKTAVDKLSSIQRQLTTSDTILSPNTEQNLADALSALVGSAADTMMVGGDCLPPIEASGADWTTPDYTEDLEVHADDWNELVSASCDQLLTSTDDDDALSDAESLTEYQRLVTSPTLSQAGVCHSPMVSAETDTTAALRDDRGQLMSTTSDAMWCNWAPENDLGGLLIFGP